MWLLYAEVLLPGAGGAGGGIESRDGGRERWDDGRERWDGGEGHQDSGVERQYGGGKHQGCGGGSLHPRQAGTKVIECVLSSPEL